MIMTDEEIERRLQYDRELDNCCDKIKFYFCCIFCVGYSIYMIIILSLIFLREYGIIDN